MTEASHGVLPDLLDAPPQANALRAPEDKSPVSYGQLANAVEELANGLHELGIGPSDRVAVVLPPGPEFIELLLATASLGAAAAPLNPSYSESEFAFYLDDLRPRAIVLPGGELAAARRATPSEVAIVEVALAPGRPPELVADRRSAPSPDRRSPTPDDVALLLHTSGTTSRPKQVPLRHRNLMASARSIVRHYELSSSDVSYCAMPLFHIHGIVASTLAPLVTRGTVIVPRRVAPGRFWSQAAGHGVTWYSASPTLHGMLLERAPATRPAAMSLRFARSSSSAMSSELAERAESYLQAPMLEAYGMTEASHEMSANPLPPRPRRVGTVGVPTGAEVQIVDNEGIPCGEGKTGEVVVRGPGIMSGYLGNDKANAEGFFGEWFRTGDQGRMLDGYLTLVGRLKEIIIRGGENISPLELEAVLMLHPAVGEAVIYGIPDKKYGQVVGAAVIPAAETTEGELIAHCKEHVAAFKVPTVVHIVESVPRTPTGKVQRPRMAAHFGEE